MENSLFLREPHNMWFTLTNVDTAFAEYISMRRKNMEDCPQVFGKVTVFVAYTGSSRKEMYDVAQRTLQCYLKSTNYTLVLVDLDTDPLVQKRCQKHQVIYYKKHCAATLYLPKTEWLLVLDADTGVVNPNHCIEEWIDDRVSVIMYERFFNWEIMAANYLVRNTPFGNEFLRKWAEQEFKQPSSWHGYDQGGLMMLLLELLIPDAVKEYEICNEYWRKATNYETYMATVICVRLALGATTVWPDKIRIYRKAEAFARDGWISIEQWSEDDFMIHGWKKNSIEEWDSPFKKEIDLSLCGQNLRAWHWQENKKLQPVDMR
ncbi:hypothetical protein Y032_0002g1019 [Ancylostoma ceylanicum]|uniref:Uncharacterized protein n=1 Tax=Ancylostoma ceylanicum TaxID=53326 RepID=A0A016W0X9_9BILA|nr:hypothetical protein Y032_0002g1019 [Ancylostoma ceylanicum]